MTALRTALFLLMAGTFSAQAANCPPDTLGTSRTLVVDPAVHPRVGTKSFPQTLPLSDKEVVLTFDDGPADTTPRVLEALRNECVLATFFLVGKGSEALPAIVRQVAAAGHSIGHHTWSHQHLNQLDFADAKREINRGIAADEAALTGRASSVPSTPFFRFPFFESTPQLLAYLQSRGITVFGADLWANDWESITPAHELELITSRLERARKGIILFHDTRAKTAEIMPAFLRYLREHDYRVVHIVPAKRPDHP